MSKKEKGACMFTAKLKRKLAMVMTLVMFILYYLSTDPDTKIFQDLTFGTGMILTFNIFVIAMAGIMVVEFLPDFFVDTIYGKEEELRIKATETPQGAGSAMIAKSLRILAYSLIVAASIVAYNVG